MHMQDKQLLFQVIPGNTLNEDVRMLGKFASVAGFVVGIQRKEGCSILVGDVAGDLLPILH